VFQRLKDAFAFGREFSRWERISDLPSILIGNRPAEMYRQSASSGTGLDVYLLRRLHAQRRSEAVERGARLGLSSRHAVLLFLCELFDEYTCIAGL
jgi:hypothetical protein